MAARYRCEFVDLRDYHLDAELFKTVPVDLMFRYNFVPLEQNDSTLSDRHRRSQQADDDR